MQEINIKNLQQKLSKIKDTKILVVGDVMLDRYWSGDTERISPEAPVPVIKINKFEDKLGGAANVAINIANLGAQVGIVGGIGQDEAGLTIHSMLQNLSIKSYLQYDSSHTTTLKLRVVARQQQIARLDFEEKLPPSLLKKIDSIISNNIKSYDLMILSDYDKGCLTNVASMIELAHMYNIPTCVDPKGNDFSKYKNATILTPNRKEMQAIVGSWQNNDELSAKAINLRTKLNLKYLLITLSEQGMLLVGDNLVHAFPTKAQEVFDVSGAGDTVMAVLASLLVATNDILIATQYANIAGGIVVGRIGTASIYYADLF
jgi:D-glycero-beta-D-manno-heptose-7-phosphate kinase